MILSQWKEMKLKFVKTKIYLCVKTVLRKWLLYFRKLSWTISEKNNINTGSYGRLKRLFGFMLSSYILNNFLFVVVYRKLLHEVILISNVFVSRVLFFTNKKFKSMQCFLPRIPLTAKILQLHLYIVNLVICIYF